ncbi:protein SPIRAL1-like 2 [Sesamum indicum]|uniref:Protein SPIRAL1-like 2 n=1 Tax=Sesamum indicum TaxID=4182 RepID=A0A6I9TIZ5_SESIN|nr:protein SPIRAL1-like 2 [Sesamum indicum]
MWVQTHPLIYYLNTPHEITRAYSFIPSAKLVQKQAAKKMGRGTSAGGGQSSLGYLFGNGEAPNPQQPKDAINEPSPKPTAPPPEMDNSKQTQTQTPSVNSGYSTNNYYRTDGQNCGNFITDRPTTKVHSAPGGSSSLNYLFGDASK